MKLKINSFTVYKRTFFVESEEPLEALQEVRAALDAGVLSDGEPLPEPQIEMHLPIDTWPIWALEEGEEDNSPTEIQGELF